MKSTFWDTRATDSIIKSGQKDTEASILSNSHRWNAVSFKVDRDVLLLRNSPGHKNHLNCLTVTINL